MKLSPGEIEVHLFGQNCRFYSQSDSPIDVRYRQKTLMEINRTITDLLRHGIGFGQIVDHRLPNFRVTHTLYDPVDRSIWFTRE